jgi:hypothetical protein
LARGLVPWLRAFLLASGIVSAAAAGDGADGALPPGPQGGPWTLLGPLGAAMPFMPSFTGDELLASRHTVLFSSLEGGPGQRFAGSGIKHAPFGTLETSGFRLMARGGGSQWSDRRRELAMDSKSEGALLFGVEQMTGRGAVGIYLGPEIATRLAPERVRRSGRLSVEERSTLNEGLRIEVGLWDHPTPETLVHLGGAFGSARGEAWGRAALGYRLTLPEFPNLFGQRLLPVPCFLGPEVELSLARDYTKWRIGAHVTNLKLLGFNLRLAVGHEQASGNMRGVYATAGIHWYR